MSAPPIVMVAGCAKDIPIECYTYAPSPTTGQAAEAAYNATDVLSGTVVQAGQTTPIFSFTPTWYTAMSTQSGYAQGEVVFPPTAAQMALLTPTIRYTVLIYRTLASGGDPDLIARVPLVIEPLAVP